MRKRFACLAHRGGILVCWACAVLVADQAHRCSNTHLTTDGRWWIPVGWVTTQAGLTRPEYPGRLWRTRVIRHAHAASHVPSDTTGEHHTSTPVIVPPRGRAPASESCVREHTPYFRCSSRTTRTGTKTKNAKMTIKGCRCFFSFIFPLRFFHFS